MATKKATSSVGNGRTVIGEAAPAAAVKKGRPAKPARGNGLAPGGGAGGSPSHSDLHDELRRFVGENPDGWGHDDWLGLLDRLRGRGHDVGDPDEVGRALERERVATKLAGVRGVGPQRIRSIVEQYGTLWDLRQADVDDLTRSVGIPRALAERIKSAG